MNKEGDIILKREELKSANLDNDLVIQKDHDDELWCVALVKVEGSRRINKDKANEIKKELEKKTKEQWEIDNISNFAFHLKVKQ